MKLSFEETTFWRNLSDDFRDIDQEYTIQHQGYPLFMELKMPSLQIKSYESFLEKTYRWNVLDNEFWPEEPQNGWLLPDNWLSRISDIVRTSFVVKYLDGVAFLVERLKVHCSECNLENIVDFEAKEEGYYAAHLNIHCNFEVPGFEYITEKIDSNVEIQVTTQLQDAYRRLSHKFYEDKRKKPSHKERWQWDHESEEFSAYYLGHILHYVEGMIVEIRDKKRI